MPRLTSRGFWLTLAALALLVTAAASGLRPLAWAGGALLGLILVSVAIAELTTRRPRLVRTVTTPRVPAGSTIHLRLAVEWDSVGLGGHGVIEEDVPPQLRGVAMAALPSGWGRQGAAQDYTLITTMRGRYRIGPCRWISADGLGLALTRRRVGGRSLVTVTPTVHRLDGTAHSSGAGMAGETSRQSSLLGQDDALVREYRPRDEIRRIHWPTTARTGTLMVRREEHAWEPSALVLLDTRAGGFEGEGARSSFEWAVSAAASIGLHLLEAGYDVEFVDAGGSVLAAAGALAKDALLEHLTDIGQSAGDDLVIPGPDGSGRGQLVIAVLGRLSPADAVTLSGWRPDGRLCRAIVLHPAPDGAEDPADILLANGWRVSDDAAAGDVARAWRALDGGLVR